MEWLFLLIIIILFLLIFMFLFRSNFFENPVFSPFPSSAATTALTSNIDLNNLSKYSILPEKNNNLLKNIMPTNIKNCYTPCNPTFVVTENGDLLVIVRFVNYIMCQSTNNSDMITINAIANIDIDGNNILSKNWKKKNENVLKLENRYYGKYGMEDVRTFNHNGVIYYTSNIPLEREGKIVIELGCINKDNKIYNNGLIYVEKNNIWANTNNMEKNWVLFSDAFNHLKIIYKWHPLIICEYVNYTENLKNYKYRLQKTHEIETIEQFKHLRGTSNGVTIGNEIWFVCHTHQYYHCIVVLNNATYNPIKFTKLFKLNDQRIEFCLGFVYFKENDCFLLGYGIQDKMTNYVAIKKNIFEKIMLNI